MMAPPNVFDHCPKTLRRTKLDKGQSDKVTFNINLWSIKKFIILVP